MSYFDRIHLKNIAKAIINPATEEKQDAGITAIGLLPKASDILDSATNAVNTVDYAHHEIHSGSHYKAGRQDTTLATSDTIELLFTTSDTTKWAHWVLTSQSTGECVVELYEDTVTSADGTAITPTNRNRNSANTATVVVTHTPTITSDGTKLVEKWLGSTGFKEDTGGETRGNSELVLKQNTKYLLRLTAVGDGIKGAVGGDWYEHTNK